MNCFEYPIDAKLLLKKKRSIKRQLLEENSTFIHKKIAILGGSTTNEVADQLEIFLLNHGIQIDIYQSEYGQFWQDAMFGNPQLNDFQADIIYIHTNWRNISVFPTINDSVESISNMLDNEFQRFETMWNKLSKTFHCPIIQNNFDRPNYRLLGNQDICDHHGRSNYIANLNQKFYQYAQTHSNFFINDIDYLAADFGLNEWNNPSYWYLYKYAINLSAIPYLSNSVANIIKSIFGKNKKALSLDLDNTLWGGIVGDDGVERLNIGPETPKGQIYSEFQEYIKKLKEIGVILTINSKNDEKNAIAGLNHPDGILRPNDFVSIKSNWEPKDHNLIETANELTLGIDSFVFIDDNPAERSIIKRLQNGISVPNLDKAENYIQILDHCSYFEVTSLSSEDKNKTNLYKAKAAAAKAQLTFPDYASYLDSLNMRAIISEFRPLYIQRIAQLTNKSNQFNLTTLRCSEDDITRMQTNNNWICLCGKLIDQFADYGIVTVVSAELINSDLHIRLWLMSCRVLEREMESFMMNKLVAFAKQHSVKNIIGYFYPTEKNSMVKDFYKKQGFSLISSDEKGNTTWSLPTSNYQIKKTHIKQEIMEE